MIEDSKRREVAARLRNQADHMAKNREWYNRSRTYRGTAGNRTYRSIADSVERYSNIGAHYEETVRKLADLVDRPTCGDTGGDKRFVCSLCGCSLDRCECYTYEGRCVSHAAPRYCPNCGAEVVV